MRRLVTLALVVVLVSVLGACGRRSQPIPPDDTTFPRPYPDITFPDAASGQRRGSERLAP